MSEEGLVNSNNSEVSNSSNKITGGTDSVVFKTQQDELQMRNKVQEWNTQIARERHFFQNYFFNKLTGGLGFNYTDFCHRKVGFTTFLERKLHLYTLPSLFGYFGDIRFWYLMLDIPGLPLAYPFLWCSVLIDFGVFEGLINDLKQIENDFRNNFERVTALENLGFSISKRQVNVESKDLAGVYIGVIRPLVDFDNVDPAEDSILMDIELEQRIYNPDITIHNPQVEKDTITRDRFLDILCLDKPFDEAEVRDTMFRVLRQAILISLRNIFNYMNIVGQKVVFLSDVRVGSEFISKESQRLRLFAQRMNLNAQRLAGFERALNSCIEERNTALMEMQQNYERGDEETILDYNSIVLRRIRDSEVGQIELSYEAGVLTLRINNLINQARFPTVGRFEFDLHTRKIVDIFLDGDQAEYEYWGFISQILMRYITEIFQANRTQAVKYIRIDGLVDVRGQANGLMQKLLIAKLETSMETLNNIDFKNINPHETFNMLGGEYFINELNTFRWRSRITNRSNRGYQYEPNFMDLI